MLTGSRLQAASFRRYAGSVSPLQTTCNANFWTSNRGALKDADGTGGYFAGVAKSGGLKQTGKFSARAFAAAGSDEHIEIGKLGIGLLVGRPQIPFEDEHVSAGLHRGAGCLQNLDAL